MSKITQKDKIRFFNKIVITDTCWEWVAAKRGHNGYGAFSLGGVCYAAHRVMFAIYHPEHEKTMLTKRVGPGFRRDYVLHSCDNKTCVKPEHLRMGSATDNAKDRTVRGRHPSSRRPPAKKGDKR
jgi:hypothetical protein